MELQIPRSVVAVIARLEDDTHRTTIGKVLHRDRSLIYHYEKSHDDNYVSWPAYRNTFNTIYSAYTDLLSAKKEFFDLQHLKSHLRENNVFASHKHQTTITVKTGKLETNVKVSYRDFYNQLENIKLALQDYKYTIKVT